MGSLLLSPVSWCAQGFICALQGSVSPALCKFWWFYNGVNGDLLQEGLCHTQVYCTQSPCPCSRPLLTHTSTGDTQTEFWLSLCGLGVCFVPFPIWKSSSNQVLHECTVPGEPYIHLLGPEPCIHLLCSGPSFSWVCCESTVSDVPYVSSGELTSGCNPPGGYQPSTISGIHG